MSEAKAREAAVRRSEAGLPIIIDSTLDPHVLLEAVRDEAGTIVDFTYADANRAACEYNRLLYEELVGARLLDLLPGHAAAGLLEQYRQVVESGEPLVLDGITYEQDLLGGEARRYDVRAVRVGDGLSYTWRDVTDRHVAAAALAASEEEFRTLAEVVPQIVWMTGADGQNTYFNQQWVDYTGMTLEESHGDGWNTPFHPDDRQRAWDAWQRATRDDAAYSLECRLRRADGAYRWWLVRGAPLRDAAGKIVKWFGTCTDIEEIKQAEEEILRLNAELEERVLARTAQLAAVNDALVKEIDERKCREVELRESEERLQIASEATGLGVHDFDVRTGRIEWDDRVREMWGVPPDEPVTYETFLEGVHPDDRERTQAALAAALDPNGSRRFRENYRVVCRDGTQRWVAATGRVAFEGEQAVRLVGTAEDVTERVSIQQRLQESEERFRSLLSSSRDVLYRVDLRTGMYDYISPSVEPLTGFAPEELMSMDRKSSMVLVHPEDLTSLEEAMRVTIESGRAEAEYRQRNRSGEYRWLSNYMLLMCDSEGAPLYRIGTIRDVTAEKEAAAVLREHEYARVAQDERVRLARDLHDSVTQSLFAATLKAEALSIAAGDPGADATAMAEEVRRLNRGALAQMRTMLLELRGDPVSEVPLKQLLRHLVEAAEGRASVKVILELDEEMAVAPRIHEAVYRIGQEALNNVVRHAKARNAWLQVHAADGQVSLVIGDDGCGFDQEAVGAGHLGLAVMRERAKEAGGAFSIKCRVGEGTIVSVDWERA